MMSSQSIIQYLQSLVCPEHDKPIKYINCLTDVRLGQRLICSDCARNGLHGYLEIEAAINKMNQINYSEPVKNSILKLQAALKDIRNKLDKHNLSQQAFVQNVRNQKSLNEFQREIDSYYNTQLQNQDEQLLTQGKCQILNSIKHLEKFYAQISSIQAHNQSDSNEPLALRLQPKLCEFGKLVFKTFTLIEVGFEDSEILIYTPFYIDIYSVNQEEIKQIQKIQLKEVEINCIVKAKYRPFIFLGRKDGIVEVFEQLSSGKYVSSHEIKAHLFSLDRILMGVLCIITNYDNSEIITGGYDALIKTWRFSKCQWINISTLDHQKQQINSLSYNLDFNLFGSTSNDCSFALFKSDSSGKYQNSLKKIEKNIVGTICFVNSTDFIISQHQKRHIKLYRIVNPLQQVLQVQQYQKIKIDTRIMDLSIKVQPIYYQDSNLFIFFNDGKNYIFRSNNQGKFEQIKLDHQQENQRHIKGKIMRLFKFGQQAIYAISSGSSETTIQLFYIK